MFGKKLLVLIGMVTVLSMLLSACGTTPAPTTPAPATTQAPNTTPETPVATAETPKPTPEAEPKTLVVCMGQEPDTLYTYGGSMLAGRHIQETIYDGPVDNRTFAYQAVILEKLPSVNDGDAVIQKVTVQEGDKVVDNNGDPVELAKDVMIRPSGCRSVECAIAFDGTPVEMDQLIATFTLKDGIKWADGEPLTADDSVYSFEILGDPDTPAAKYGFERTASYVAKDDKTTVWTGLPGYIDSTYFLNFYTPLPRHLWQEQLGYAAKDLLEKEETSRMPMGWGAYKITEWVQGDHITVEKNPNYYRASEGMPYIDTIIFRFVPDSNAVVAQLISGECDVATQDGSLDDQAEMMLQLEEQKVLVPIFMTGTAWEHLDFNMMPVEGYEQTIPFTDLRVRQAFAYCLNSQEIIDTLLYGRSIVPRSYIPPEHPLYAGDDVLPEYPFDPEKGKALLAEVGWVDSDGDGILEAAGVEGVKDGTKFEIKWSSTTATLRVQYMQIYQKQLADCGIKVNLDNMPSAEWFADGPDGPLFGRRFDVGSFTWLTGVEPPCDLYGSWAIPNEEHGWGSSNDTGFNNAEYDAACKKALQALPGTDEYIQGHKEAQRIFAEQLPVVSLFLRLKIAAYRPEVTGFIMDPTNNSELWNVEVFDIQR